MKGLLFLFLVFISPYGFSATHPGLVKVCTQYVDECPGNSIKKTTPYCGFGSVIEVTQDGLKTKYVLTNAHLVGGTQTSISSLGESHSNLAFNKDNIFTDSYSDIALIELSNLSAPSLAYFLDQRLIAIDPTEDFYSKIAENLFVPKFKEGLKDDLTDENGSTDGRSPEQLSRSLGFSEESYEGLLFDHRILKGMSGLPIISLGIDTAFYVRGVVKSYLNHYHRSLAAGKDDLLNLLLSIKSNKKSDGIRWGFCNCNTFRKYPNGFIENIIETHKSGGGESSDAGGCVAKIGEKPTLETPGMRLNEKNIYIIEYQSTSYVLNNAALKYFEHYKTNVISEKVNKFSAASNLMQLFDVRLNRALQVMNEDPLLKCFVIEENNNIKLKVYPNYRENTSLEVSLIERGQIKSVLPMVDVQSNSDEDNKTVYSIDFSGLFADNLLFIKKPAHRPYIIVRPKGSNTDSLYTCYRIKKNF